MGQSFNDSLSNMKMFVVLALAALAYAEPEAKPEAEADAALLYGAYGYAGYPYAAGYAGYPYGYRTHGYPYTYGYYGKRSADAGPEAEADPALLYTTSHVVNPVTSYVAGSPLVYNTHPVTSVNNVPVVKAAVNTVPVVNTVYNALPLTHSLVNTVPAATTTVSKREAEADPALVYTTGLTTPYVHHVAQPVVYNTAVHHPVTYAAPVVKAPAHGLALTAAGYTHSSNVGVCLNNMGVQVP